MLGLLLEDVHSLLDKRDASVPALGGGKVDEELLVAFDDDRETVVAEAERLLRLEGNDVLDRNDHLHKSKSRAAKSVESRGSPAS